MINDLKKHIEEVKAFTADNLETIEAFRIKYLGKKGLLNDFLIGDYGVLSLGLANAVITVLPHSSFFLRPPWAILMNLPVNCSERRRKL